MVGSSLTRALALAISAAAAAEAAVDPFAWRALELRSERQVEGGGAGGARIQAIAWSPHDPVRVLAGTDRNGVWFSTDSGASFQPSEGLELPDVKCVGFAPWKNGKAFCLAAASRDRAPFAASRKEGLWRSSDGGKSWEFVIKVTLEEDAFGNLVGFLETGQEKVIAAGSHGRGLIVSRDGGESWGSWQRLGNRGWIAGILTVSGGFLVATNEGVFRSTDAGQTFGAVPELQAARFVTTRGAVLSAGSGDPPPIYLAWSEAGMYRSADNGATWKLLGKRKFLPEDYFAAVYASPHPGGPVLATVREASKRLGRLPLVSRDGGVTWREPAPILAKGRFTGPAAYASEAVAFDPGMAGVVLAGIDRELMRSTDGGSTWGPWARGVYGWRCGGPHFAARSPLEAYKLWVALGESGLWFSGNAGRWFRQLLRTPERCIGVACHPDPSRMLLVSWWDRGEKLTLRQSRDGGRSWEAPIEGVPTLPSVIFHPVKSDTVYCGRYVSEDLGKQYRELPVHVLAIAGRTGSAVYGLDVKRPRQLMRSDDGGRGTWKAFGAVLPATPRAAAVHPASPHDLFVGTTDGLYRSHRDGTWRKVGLDRRLFSQVHITSIIIDEQGGTRILAAVADPWLRRGGILFSTDGGESFRLHRTAFPVLGLVSTGPPDEFLAATDVGLYRIHFSR